MSLNLWLKKKLFTHPVITASYALGFIGTGLYAYARVNQYIKDESNLLDNNTVSYESAFMRELAYELNNLLKTEGKGIFNTRAEVYSKLGNVKVYRDELESYDDFSTTEAKEAKANFDKAALGVLYEQIANKRPAQNLGGYDVGREILLGRLGLSGEVIASADLPLYVAPTKVVKAPKAGASRQEVVAYFNELADSIVNQ